VVSREGPQRETTQLVINEYCSDLTDRPVLLRPIPPHQVVIHRPILHNSDPALSALQPDGYIGGVRNLIR
jgi:hypothetical protein